MCGSTPGWRRRSSLPLPPSCSGRRLTRRRAESAARKSFCPTSGALIPSDNAMRYDDDDDLDDCEVEIKNEDDARPVEPGWPPDSLRSANHTTVLKSTTSSPSNDLQRHQHCSFDIKHQLHQKPDSNLLQEVVFRRKFNVIARSKTPTGIGGLPKDAEYGGRQRVPSMRKGAEY